MNLLLPFLAQPTSKPSSLDTSLLLDGNQPLSADTSSIIDNTGQVDLAGTSSEEEDSSAITTDAVNVPSWPSNKYVVPQKEINIQSFGHTISPQTCRHYLREPGGGLCGKHPVIGSRNRVFNS